MRWRRARWWIAGAIGVIVVAVLSLARTEDPLASIRQLHPTERLTTRYLSRDGGRLIVSGTPATGLVSQTCYSFDFTCNPELVKAVIRPDTFDLLAFSESTPAKAGGVTCHMMVAETLEPWYTRTWGTIKRRLHL